MRTEPEMFDVILQTAKMLQVNAVETFFLTGIFFVLK